MPGGIVGGRIKRLKMTEISGVDYPAHLDNGFAIKKAAGQPGEGSNMTDNGEVVEKSVADATPEELAEVAKGFTVEQAEAVAKALGLEKAAAPAEPVVEDVTKGLAPEQVALVKSLESQVEALRKSAESAQAQVAIEKAARLDAEAIQKSKAEYANLTVDHAVLAPALRKMREQDAKVAEAIEGVLKSVNAQASELFKEVGTTGAGAHVAGGAFAELENIAKSFISEGKADNMAEGINKALDARPDLYSAYVKGE